MQRLVGIAGRAGSGKDTAADALCDVLDYARIALADPIKAALAAMIGCARADLEDRIYKERSHPVLAGRTPRHAMQTLGTEWGRRMMAPDLWLAIASARIEAAAAALARGVVVTDVRFEDEADWVRARGGVVRHVQRPGLGEAMAHASEAGVVVKPTDLVVVNAGTIAELHAQVFEVVRAWERRR